MQKLNNEKVERLIEFVKSNPFFYDKTHNTYKNIDVKEAAWQALASELFIEVNDCKRAWRSLRDQFQKAFKTRQQCLSEHTSEKSNKASYKHFDQLLFLKNSLEPNSSSCDINFTEILIQNDESNLDLYEVVEEESYINTNSDECTGTEEKFPPIVKVSSTTTKHELSHGAEKDFKDLFSPMPAKIPRRQELNDVDNFFLNLSSTVKQYNLSLSDWARFQCKILTYTVDELEKIKQTQL